MALTRRLRTAWRTTDVVASRPRRALVMAEWVARSVEESVVDVGYRRRGLDTGGPDFDQLDGALEERGYVPTEWRVLRTLFPPGSLGPDDVLLDYGCGRGRVAIWAASQFPLRRVVGIDRDEGLTATARANLERWRGPRRCTDVTFTCADAGGFEVPDDVTVVYLFNPFMGDVFRRAVARLGESLVRAPRTLRIVYFYPIMHEVLIDAGYELERSHRHVLYAWATYRVGPGAAPDGSVGSSGTAST